MLKRISCFLFIALLIVPVTYAQPSDCGTLIELAVADTLAACQNAEVATLCRGFGNISTSPIATNQAGDTLPLANVLEFVVNADTVSMVQIKFAPNTSTENPTQTTGFVFGEALLNRGSESWQVFTIQATDEVCRNDARQAGVLLQTVGDTRAVIRVNEVDVSFNRTIFIRLNNGSLQVNVIEGDAILNTGSPVIFSGFQWTAGEAAPTPYDYLLLNTVPVNLLPRIPRLALPGHVSVTTETSLFEQTRSDSRAITQLLPGTLLNVYGSDLTGQWRHVLTPTGEEGWVPATVLEGTISGTVPAYEATPQLMSRPYGYSWGRGGTGFGQVNLRNAPADDAGILTILPAQVEFSLYGRSPDSRWVYVMLDAPVNGISEGWLSVPFIDLPPDLRIGELPPAQ
jgi:SH3-like domain-containing protein